MRGAYLLVLVLIGPGFTQAQHWELEQLDSARRIGLVGICRDSSDRLWVCYDTWDLRTGAGIVRLSAKDSGRWRPRDMFHGMLNYGRPAFSTGPHGEMSISCFDTTCRSYLVELTDTGWVTSQPGIPATAGDVSVVYDTAGQLCCGFRADPNPHRYWIARRIDTVWTTTALWEPFATGWYIFHSYCIGVSADDRLWYLAAIYWEYSQHVNGAEMALFRGTESDWDTIWHADAGTHAVGLAASADTALFCRYPGPRGGYLHCGDEVVDPIWYWQDAGMAIDSAGVPHIAYLGPSGNVRYAFRTNRWHVDSVPNSEGARSTDIVIDRQGQPNIVFGTADRGIWLARGIDVVGAEEQPTVERQPCAEPTTIVNGVMWQAPAASLKLQATSLLDATGRKVLELMPGPNDVRHLAPGVYFVRSDPSAVTKVVITR